MSEPKTSRALLRVGRGLGRIGREQAHAAAGLTPQQAEALQLIADLGAVSTSVLAVRLGIDPSTASRNLGGLERSGYVAKRRGPDDGRTSDIRLTARGRRLAEVLSNGWARAYAALLDRMPRSERQSVSEALQRLADLVDPRGAR